MSDERLPLLRGRIEREREFVPARGGGGKKPALPPRDPAKHHAELMHQLDELVREVERRPAGSRDSEARREIVAVVPTPGYPLAEPSLGDSPTDVRVVGADPSTGTVLLDAPNAQLVVLRRKIDEFADATKLTPNGHAQHAPLVAPIHEIHSARFVDVADDAVQNVPPGTACWVELGCRGGVYAAAESARSRREIQRQIERLGSELKIAAQFTATSQVVFYVKLTIGQIVELLAAVDCVYEVHLAERRVRDWLLLEHDERDLGAHVQTPPPRDAPTVVIIDTGLAVKNPLLERAILDIASVVPGITSGADIDGHGTQMAGVALHLDGVGDAVVGGSSAAQHWVQGVKIITSASSTSDEGARAAWAPMTVAATEQAELVSPGRRVYALAVTAPIEPVAPTTWSQAVDQLAHDDGRGRVICVAAGNADSSDVNVINGYPQLNLVQSIEEPAQAWNALTVGAFTVRSTMPPDDSRRAYQVVAPAGGISPHASSRPLDADRVPNKPDVVVE